MDIENFNFLLTHIVNEFIKSRNVDFSERDSLLNEARVAAFKAVGDFKEEKMVKITTYVTTCVKNHLINMNKKNYRNKNRLDKAAKRGAEVLVEYETRRSGPTVEDLEFTLTMKSLLTACEFNVFEMRFIQDCTLVDIQKAFGMSRREVEKCLRHICLKYGSLEENLSKTLMQRQLQSKWLEDSVE